MQPIRVKCLRSGHTYTQIHTIGRKTTDNNFFVYCQRRRERVEGMKERSKRREKEGIHMKMNASNKNSWRPDAHVDHVIFSDLAYVYIKIT